MYNKLKPHEEHQFVLHSQINTTGRFRARENKSVILNRTSKFFLQMRPGKHSKGDNPVQQTIQAEIAELLIIFIRISTKLPVDHHNSIDSIHLHLVSH